MVKSNYDQKKKKICHLDEPGPDQPGPDQPEPDQPSWIYAISKNLEVKVRLHCRDGGPEPAC